jgi:hypothetical protein
MEKAFARIGLYVSILVVAFLARRPKLPIVILGTVLPSIALADRLLQGRIPLWIWIAGFVAASLALAAVVLAVFLARAGLEGGDFGAIPFGREVRYSASDRDALLGTVVALMVGIGLSVLVLIRPPIDLSFMARIAAGVALPLFMFGLVVFWKLYRQRDIVLRIAESGLGVRRAIGQEELFVPWTDIAGYQYAFGIFSVTLTNGETLVRVDSIIDGFFALLYHVNRHTFKRT